jgi:hypothetical protein
MEWSAQITEKSEVTSDGVMTYSFIALADGEPVNGIFTVTGEPSVIQQLISTKITTFAEAYELAETLPNIDEVLQIITNE